MLICGPHGKLLGLHFSVAPGESSPRPLKQTLDSPLTQSVVAGGSVDWEKQVDTPEHEQQLIMLFGGLHGKSDSLVQTKVCCWHLSANGSLTADQLTHGEQRNGRLQYDP